MLWYGQVRFVLILWHRWRRLKGNSERAENDRRFLIPLLFYAQPPTSQTFNDRNLFDLQQLHHRVFVSAAPH